jgi:hypothetical protein
MRGVAGAIAIAAFMALAGCASSAPSQPLLPETTQREWTRMRQRLASARSLEPGKPFVEEIIVAMREPRTRKVFQARGALAIDPHRAMRMILVGPGGTTALDVWVTDQRWRFVVPALSIKRSGGADAESSRGLPIGFFRWWMLHPLDGRLLSAWLAKGDPIYLLRNGGDTVLLRDHSGGRGHHVIAMRRESGETEQLEWLGRAPMPHAGDRARYVDDASGLEVEVLIEGVSEAEPDPAAFLDPDQAGTSL